MLRLLDLKTLLMWNKTEAWIKTKKKQFSGHGKATQRGVRIQFTYTQLWWIWTAEQVHLLSLCFLWSIISKSTLLLAQINIKPVQQHKAYNLASQLKWSPPQRLFGRLILGGSCQHLEASLRFTCSSLYVGHSLFLSVYLPPLLYPFHFDDVHAEASSIVGSGACCGDAFLRGPHSLGPENCGPKFLNKWGKQQHSLGYIHIAAS